MKVIYEDPNVFRITYIPACYASSLGSSVIENKTPYLLQYRSKGKLETVELPEDLFMLYKIYPNIISVMNRYNSSFRLSEEMIEQFFNFASTECVI